MNKEQFLAALQEALSGLPQAEIDERVGFYAEMIDDKIEEGISQEDAVKEIGNIDDIVFAIVDDISLHSLVIKKVKPKRRLSVFEIVLIVLGFPVWFSLLVAAFAVVIALYLSLWAVVVSLWAADASLWGGALGGLVGGIALMCNGNLPQGLVLIAAAFVCAGLAILLIFGCKAATKGVLVLAKKIVFGIKKCFIRKEKKQ